MDKETREHLQRWLDSKYRPEEHATIRRRILYLLDDYPDLISSGRSWSEMERLSLEYGGHP